MINIRYVFPVTIAFALVFFAWSVSFAEYEADVAASANAEASGEVKAERKDGRPVQLLKGARKNFLGAREDVRDEIKEVREAEKEKRSDVRADIKAETNVEVRKEMRSTEKERRADARDDIKEKRTDMREELKEKREEARDGLRARVNNLLRAHLGAIINRLSVSLRYFDRVVERTGSRIEKLKGRGIDTVSVEASLAAAVDLVAKAKTDVKAITDIVDRASDTSNPATLKAELRGAIEKATESVRTAHRLLVKVSREIVALVRAQAGADAEVSVSVDDDN